MFYVDSEGGISRIRTGSDAIDEGEDKIAPMNLLCVSSVGGGKSLAMEQMVNYYYRNGSTVISLSDVKDSVEFGFAAFEPKAPYHLTKLRKFGCPVGAVPCKFYHPFTFNLPKSTREPDFNIYTLNIKELTSIDLGFLSESRENKRSVQILLETLHKMSRNDGIHHLIFRSEEQTESVANLMKSTVKYRSDNPDDFFTKSKIGTEKTSGEMNAYFKPFLVDYALAPATCKLNLDVEAMMNDQKHYHIFSTRWIKDRRLKAFFVNAVLQQIILNADKAKHPICIYLEEIRFLTPNSSEGFAAFLAEELKNTMTRFRNMGKGFTIISSTQVYRDVHPAVIDSFNEVVLGRIASFKEIEFIGKALKLTSQDVTLIKSLEVGDFIIKVKDKYSDESELQKIKFFMPPHAHKEQGYSFFDWYEKNYPEKMTTFNSTIEYMKSVSERVITEVSALKDEENVHKKAVAQQDREQKAEKYTKYVEALRNKIQTQKMQKVTERIDEIDEKMKYAIYNEWQSATGKDKSNRAIAKKFNLYLRSGELNHKAVQRAIAYCERKKAAETPTENGEVNENIDPEEMYDDAEEKSNE